MVGNNTLDGWVPSDLRRFLPLAVLRTCLADRVLLPTRFFFASAIAFLQSKDAKDTLGAGIPVLEGGLDAQEQALTRDERLGGPEFGQQRLGNRLGRGRVLAGDHKAIDHHMGLPVSPPGK